MKTTHSSPEGYILEVDLEYPPNLHEEHNSFPLAPEKRKLNLDIIGDYAKTSHAILYNSPTARAACRAAR